MDLNHFALTTAELASLARTAAHNLQRTVARKGHWKGLIPRKQPNGRLLWPRDEALRALGFDTLATDPDVVDRADVLEFFRDRGLPVDDPITKACADALCGRYAGKGYEGAACDDLGAVQAIAAASCSRVSSTLARISLTDLKHAAWRVHGTLDRQRALAADIAAEIAARAGMEGSK